MDDITSDDKLHNRKTISSKNNSHISERSLIRSFRASIAKVSDFYEQTSKVISKISDGSNSDEDEFAVKKIKKKISNNLLEHINVEKEPLKEEESLSFFATLFIYIKVNIVAGFLFLPSGFFLGGWLFSIIAIIFVSIVVAYCNVSLAECTDEVNSYSFTVIAFKSLGNFGKYLVEYGIAISQICFPCSYANLIATVSAKLIETWFGIDATSYYWVIGLVLMVILIPLCFLRKISAFNQLHLIGDIAVLTAIIALLINCFDVIANKADFDMDNYKMINSGWSKLLGMAVTTLEGVGVILPIKESMKDKKDFNKVIYIGIFFVIFILIGFPLIAFFSYGKDTPEIILTVLPFEKIYIQVVMVLLIFSILVVYPVQLNPAFRILEHYFIKCEKNKLTYENMLRTTILLITVVIGIASIDKFANMMALAGCAVCTPVALIFPTLFHYKLFKEKQSKIRSFFDVSIFVIGIGLSLTILVFTLLDW